MIYLVIGGSGSGKSAYAEQLACKLSGTGRRYYLATMQVYGQEGRERVARHRKLREGKGFATIEKMTDVNVANDVGEQDTVLLECMSNLVANEMFGEQGQLDGGEVVRKVCRDVLALAGRIKHLVIVTNNVFEDGIRYDAGTAAYMEALAKVNRRLCAASDAVVEVVYTIPVVWKNGGRICLS